MEVVVFAAVCGMALALEARDQHRLGNRPRTLVCMAAAILVIWGAMFYVAFG